MKMQKPAYKIYPSLLDAYQWYLDCDQTETAFQDIIDKINRVPFESEAAAKGTAFNEIVDFVAHKDFPLPDDIVYHSGFTFKSEIVAAIAKEVEYGLAQVYCTGEIETKFGIVQLYGYIDEMLPGGIIVDIKTTSSYDKGKYLKNWQHIVYPYCEMQNTGFEDYSFTYLITDFNRIYVEDYVFNTERDTQKLKLFLEDFIQFVESHKTLITDKKIFGGEKELAL